MTSRGKILVNLARDATNKLAASLTNQGKNLHDSVLIS